MSKLALLGGNPVTDNLVGKGNLIWRKDLERKFLLEAYDTGAWDDWNVKDSLASKFKKGWASFNRAKYCALLTNGTHTLQLALEAVGIGAGDEVIVPGITWQATASAVCDVNAIPVLVDIDPDTLCIDPREVEAAATSRTRAIIPVHLYHRMADMDAIMKIAKKHKLRVIEDCAHSHGSQWKGKGAGSIGDFGSFSFQRSKLMNSGEGGALLSQNEMLHSKVSSMAICGRPFNGYRMHNGNYRMTNFQAAILLGQLAAYRKNAWILDCNGKALDKAVDLAPGAKSLHRARAITRQCSYCFAFLYDKTFYSGLGKDVFMKALSAEFGNKVGFSNPYTPLNDSDLYYPHTRKRFHWSKAFARAIAPSRWKLPASEDAFKNRAVTSWWKSILSCPPERAHLLTDAITKIHEHHQELLTYSKKKQG